MSIVKNSSLLFTKILVAVFIAVLLGVCGVIWLYSGKTSELKWKALSKLHLPVGKVGDTYMFADIVHPYSELNILLGEGAPSLGRMLALEAVAKNKFDLKYNDLEEVKVVLESDSQFKKIRELRSSDFALNTLGRQYIINYKLALWYVSNTSLEPEIHFKAEAVLNSLNSGESWADVAAGMSDDTATKWFAGDTGYVNLSKAIPEYSEAVEKLPMNVPSVVYSRYGIHVVKVLERVKHGGEDLVSLQEVFIKSNKYDSWLAAELQKQAFTWYLQ